MMLETIALLAAAQAVGVSPPAVRARPQTALAAYIGHDDYPPSARARNEEGHVAFHLVVGSDGRVMGCNILGSSGSSALDNTTCRIMRSRARFIPARDPDGNAAVDSGLAVIRWRLLAGAETLQEYLPSAPGARLAPVAPTAGPAIQPARARVNLASYVFADDYPASARLNGEQGTVRFTLDIGADGRVTSCRITGSSSSSALDSTTCRIMRSRARFTPALNASGQAVPDSVSSSITWRSTASGDPKGEPSPP